MISVLFENDDIVAVDKPEGVAVIPERDLAMGSLLEALSTQRRERLYVVHRIDKETSGLVMFARNAEAHRWFNRQFEARTVQKTYLALVRGRVEDNKGVVDKPLRQFGSGRVGVDVARGKASITQYQVVERFDLFTLVQAYPKTGRRHQIRVHFYSIGHPVAGDPLYGDKTIQQDIPRLMLHAQQLVATLPSGESLTVQTLSPESFNTVLDTVS